MNQVLRRRAEMPPLVPFRELQDEGNDDIFEVFIDYISPCQILVSNDPNEIVVSDEPNPCNITLYDCSGLVADGTTIAATTTNPTEIVVEFDYEMHYTMGADFNTTLQGLEGSILEHLATATGVVDCPITAGVQFVRNRELQAFPELFSAISSEPIDEKDPEFEDCLVPVQSSISATSNCEPMKGSFTAFVKPEIPLDAMQEATIRSGLQRFVRDGMNNDIYVTGNLRKASFIGTRTGEEGQTGIPTTGVSNEGVGDGSGSGNGGLDTLGITLLSVGIFAALALGVAALVYRHKRRSEEEAVAKEDSRRVSFAEPAAVAADDLEGDPKLYRRRDDIENIENMEGSEIPGSLATTDYLAIKKKQGEHGVQPAASGAPKSAVAATGVSAAGMAVGSHSSSRSRSKSSSDPARKKKRREKERRKKVLPSLEGNLSLDSIPEEATDDELLLEQVESSDGGTGEENSSADNEADENPDEETDESDPDDFHAW